MANDVRRVVGLIQDPRGQNFLFGYPYAASLHSFLIIGDAGHKIDNTFYGYEENNLTPSEIAKNRESEIFLDEDPLTTKKVVFGSSGFSKWNEVLWEKDLTKWMLLWTPDIRMEQTLAFFAMGTFSPRSTLYDLFMRNFIAEKYGVEIPSLPQVWSPTGLCWHCFTHKDKLYNCTSCKIAVYCSKDCQSQDWKVHKVQHELLKVFLEQEANNAFLHFFV